MNPRVRGLSWGLGLSVLALSAVALLIGPAALSAEQVLAVLMGKGSIEASLIVREIRLPRLLLAKRIHRARPGTFTACHAITPRISRLCFCVHVQAQAMRQRHRFMWCATVIGHLRQLTRNFRSAQHQAMSCNFIVWRLITGQSLAKKVTNT